MAISLDEVQDLAVRFHQVLSGGGTVEALQDFFAHPEGGRVFLLHGADVSLEENVELHKGFEDEHFIPMEPWSVTQLSTHPEKARLVGHIYWKAHPAGSPDKLLESIVGEDWIVQRCADGQVRFVVYINSHHLLLPGSAPTGLYDKE